MLRSLSYFPKFSLCKFLITTFMLAFRIAFSLIRIPRLFATLFLLPILASILIVYVQLLATGVFLKTVQQHKNATAMESSVKEGKKLNILRRILFGKSEALPPPKICRWQARLLENGKKIEEPTADCSPGRLDVALRVLDPETFDPFQHVKIFNGNLEKLHLCRTCNPDLVISRDKEGEGLRSDAKSVFSLLELSLFLTNDEAQTKMIEFKRGMDEMNSLIGDIYFHAKDLREPVKLTDLENSIAVVFNLVFLVIIALWLALRAHRKVLDYFARNGALLPMVASTGKLNFYSAIWLLTTLRVSCFLLAAIPVTWDAFKMISDEKSPLSFLGENHSEIALWAVTVITSLSLATIIASIADLKQRHSILSILYRYVPIIICIAGALVWGGSFFLASDSMVTLRYILGSLPLIGIVPVLIAPVMKPQVAVLMLNALFSLGLIFWLLRINARWFAAHLEEL